MKEKDWVIVLLIAILGYTLWRNHKLKANNQNLLEKNKQLELLKLKFVPPKVKPKPQPPEKPEQPPQGGPKGNGFGNPKRLAI